MGTSTISSDFVCLFVDGATGSNPGMGGIAVAWKRRGKEPKCLFSSNIGLATNNVAELMAVEAGIDIAEKLINKGKSVAIFSDSRYVVGILTEPWEARKNLELVSKLRERLKTFPDSRLAIEYIPREYNLADPWAKAARLPA